MNWPPLWWTRYVSGPNPIYHRALVAWRQISVPFRLLAILAVLETLAGLVALLRVPWPGNVFALVTFLAIGALTARVAYIAGSM
jgi:hypothetical protein